jgi:chromosomal replication initiation ATPase DnaA
VIHAVRQVTGFIEFDESFKCRYADFESNLNQMIKDYSVPQKKPKLSEIIQTACDYLNITKEELRSSSREPQLIDKRFMITAFLYNDMDYSIGILKNALCRNYSNIHNAANRIQDRLKHDKVFIDRYNRFVNYMQRKSESITVVLEATAA